MSCVGCDKCKLWGKLQTQGLGTALKILYSEKLNLATESGLWDKPHIEADPIFRLSRTEIVALFNAFGRCVLNDKMAFLKYLHLYTCLQTIQQYIRDGEFPVRAEVTHPDWTNRATSRISFASHEQLVNSYAHRWGCVLDFLLNAVSLP